MQHRLTAIENVKFQIFNVLKRSYEEYYNYSDLYKKMPNDGSI